MKYFNYHTHTLYCDGSANPEIYIKEAIKRNMSSLGFSSHSPLPFNNNYSIKSEIIEEYKTVITDLKKKYDRQIDIYLGLEFDYIPGISDDFDFLKNKLCLDYTIGSVHLVKNKTDALWFIDGPESNYTRGLSDIFKDDIKQAVNCYYEQIAEMITTQRPSIAGHIDKIKMNNKGRYFSENESWYKSIAKKSLKAALKTGCIIEVNTRGIYKQRCDSLYPGLPMLEEVYMMKIPITISADAHKPEELTSYFPETLEILRGVGFRKIKYFDGKRWADQKI